jgi:peptidoglycan/xylan/chitin deacetylase (PgdA/CDA1 family)
VREALKRIVPRRLVRLAREPRAEIAEARLYLERHALASLGRRAERRRGRILAYHSVGQREYGVNDVEPPRFRRQIELALAAGYRFVPASQIVRTGGGPKDLAVTFDDGLKSVLTAAAPILAEHQIPYVVFAVSDWSEMKHPWCRERVMGWRELEALMAQGAEIGSHSASHPDFARISHQQAVDELGVSRDVIRQRLGFAPTSFAIPFGQSGNWPAACHAAARDAGYEIIYAQAEDTRPAGAEARTFVTRHDSDRIFKALLNGAYDRWEEWF